MGRRKSTRKPPTKTKVIEPLPRHFSCPFCNREGSCEVELNKEKKVGYVKCGICLEDYQTSINTLSQPIDVYNEWIDECEAVNS